mmetsp:Transcript_15947/g.39089  ORF Transcript_15947/g.39089 Transcript_15947/m.39089 type:complete len:293 (-) Transcript_15947:313-1191(-)
MEDESIPKVSSHSQKEDIATVERTEDDKSWMELSFVDDDGNEKSIADLAAINTRPPDSVSLDALTLEDDASLSSGDLNDNPKAAEPPKPIITAEPPKPAAEENEAKPTSRRRPKKTKTHRKVKSFDDRILLDSESTRKKKKKKDKKSKGGSGEFSAKSKRRPKKRSSKEQLSDDRTDEQLLSGEAPSDDQSLLSNQSSATSKSSKVSKPNSKRRGLRSLSPVRIRNPLRGVGLVRQLSGKGGGLMGRARDLKDQLTMSEHVPGESKRIMGTVLYSSFDNDDDSDLDDDDFFS